MKKYPNIPEILDTPEPRHTPERKLVLPKKCSHCGVTITKMAIILGVKKGILENFRRHGDLVQMPNDLYDLNDPINMATCLKISPTATAKKCQSCGFTTAEMAKLLEVSQSAISIRATRGSLVKMPNGLFSMDDLINKSALMPNRSAKNRKHIPARGIIPDKITPVSSVKFAKLVGVSRQTIINQTERGNLIQQPNRKYDLTHPTNVAYILWAVSAWIEIVHRQKVNIKTAPRRIVRPD